LYLLLHAALITLTDDGNDEVHEDNIPDYQNEEPEEPCQDFGLFSAFNDRGCVVVADGLTQCYHEICCQLYSFIFISRFLDYDLCHDCEASNDKKEEEDKD
jgi:hypothetical protein